VETGQSAFGRAQLDTGHSAHGRVRPGAEWRLLARDWAKRTFRSRSRSSRLDSKIQLIDFPNEPAYS
jgi:hypothetical protein